MIYIAIPKLEEHERKFIVDVALNINSARIDNQLIPNKELVKSTEKLIKKHNINFAHFMYVLEKDTDKKIWNDNAFQIIFGQETLDGLERVLFETYKKIFKK